MSKPSSVAFTVAITTGNCSISNFSIMGSLASSGKDTNIEFNLSFTSKVALSTSVPYLKVTVITPRPFWLVDVILSMLSSSDRLLSTTSTTFFSTSSGDAPGYWIITDTEGRVNFGRRSTGRFINPNIPPIIKTK